MQLSSALSTVLAELEYSGRLLIKSLPVCETARMPIVAYALKHGLVVQDKKSIVITLRGIDYINNQ